MAESYVNVTEGSGKKLHTNTRLIGSDTVHDEVVVAGEPYLASYVALGGGVDIVTANAHTMALMAGASKLLRVRRIRIRQAGLAAAASVATFSVMRLTTAGSGGTSVTPAPLDTSDPAAGATARTLPTSKGTESTELFRLRMGVVAAFPTTGDHEVEWVQLPNQKPIVVQSGTSNGLVVKCLSGLASATVDIYIEFDETSF